VKRSGWFWLAVGAIYFFIPLAATAEFSLKDGDSYSLAAYREIFNDPQFRDTFVLSLKLAIVTIIVALLLFIPTVYWVHLRLPRVRPFVQFISALPFVVPPIVLIVGILYVYNYQWVPGKYLGSPYYLIPGYVVLAFPFMFFTLDNAFRAIDVHTLTEASQSLGAGWIRTLWRVILPNISAGAIAGAFLTFALVMGEFTMASLALFSTFPTYINYIGQTKANPAAALTIISFGITWLALLGILFVGRRPGRTAVQVGGAREWRISSCRSCTRSSATSRPSRRSTSRSRPANSSRCSVRRGAGRRPRSGSWRASRCRHRAGWSSRATTSPAFRPTGATWAWFSRPIPSSPT